MGFFQNDSCPTCRRPFISSQSAESETSQDQPETDASTDNPDAEDFLDILRGALGIRGNSPNREQHRETRNDYIGLYS